MGHVFFGLKEKFGIELEIYNQIRNVGKARFWVENKPLGEFKVKHKLSYLLAGLKELLKNESILWDERFLQKSPEEIATMCWYLKRDILEANPQELEEMMAFKKFSPFFGDQFDSQSNIIYLKDGKFHFIWTLVTDYSSDNVDYLKNLQSAQVDASYVKEVIERFLNDHKKIN